MRHADKADKVILDLEDGLGAADQEAGRERVRRVLADDAGRYWLRPHSPRLPEFTEDVAGTAGVAGLVLPKVENPNEVQEAAELGVPLILMVESAKGLLELERLVKSSPLVQGLAFGSEDFSATLSLSPFSAGRVQRLDHARYQLLLIAAAYQLRWCLDSPVLTLNDTELMADHAAKARGLGFTGMLAIHPSQAPAIRHGFAESEAESAWRAEVTGGKRGAGASRIGDQMIDAAVVRQAIRSIVTNDADEEQAES